MQVEPQQEHRWLEKFVGRWNSEMEAQMGPDEPPMKHTGTEIVRSLGGVWILCEGEGEMPDGGIGRTLMTLGYDPQKKRFVGTFVGSMMTNLWRYEGTLDSSGKVLTLDTEGPNFTQDAIVPYQDMIELVDDDHRILRSQIRTDDGSWLPFMTAHYYRQK